MNTTAAPAPQVPTSNATSSSPRGPGNDEPTTDPAPPPAPVPEPAAPPPLPADRSTWTTEQYEQALTRLSSLQTRIDGLRDAIPSLIRPLAALQPSRQGGRRPRAPNPLASRVPVVDGGGAGSEGEISSSGQKKDRSRGEARREGAGGGGGGGGGGGSGPGPMRVRKDKVVFEWLRTAAREHVGGVRELKVVWDDEATRALLRVGGAEGKTEAKKAVEGGGG